MAWASERTTPDQPASIQSGRDCYGAAHGRNVMENPGGDRGGTREPWSPGGRGQGRVRDGEPPQLPNIVSHCSAVFGRNTKFMRLVSPIDADGSME